MKKLAKKRAKKQAFVVAMLVPALIPTAMFGQAQGTGRTGYAQPQQPQGRQERSAVAGQPQPEPRDGAREAFRRSGGSLYRMEQRQAEAEAVDTDIFAVAKPDPRRIRKHDLITVIVREESDSQSKSSTDTKKTADFNAVLEQYFRLTGLRLSGRPQDANQPTLRMQGERNFKGEGTVDRSDSMTARVQAEVIDVKPNGVLVIQAQKQIKMDEEEIRLTLTGQVRAEDVTIDNSVLSSQLADLQLEKVAKGAARDASKRGWIVKFFDFINPF